MGKHRWEKALSCPASGVLCVCTVLRRLLWEGLVGFFFFVRDARRMCGSILRLWEHGGCVYLCCVRADSGGNVCVQGAACLAWRWR